MRRIGAARAPNPFILPIRVLLATAGPGKGAYFPPLGGPLQPVPPP